MLVGDGGNILAGNYYVASDTTIEIVGSISSTYAVYSVVGTGIISN